MPTWTYTQPTPATEITTGWANTNFSALQVLLNGQLEGTNLAANAGILLSQLGQSGATTGQIPEWNGSAWVPTTPGSISIPSGTVVDFGGSSAPSGWLLCDGTAVSRTTYAALFGVIGTSYGAGDGSTTFNLPDARGRVSVGQGTHGDVNSLSDNDGVAVGNRSPKHKHTVNDPGHSHSYESRGGGNDSNGGRARSSTDPFAAYLNTENSATNITVGPQSGEPTDGPAYLVFNKIIKT